MPFKGELIQCLYNKFVHKPNYMCKMKRLSLFLQPSLFVISLIIIICMVSWRRVHTKSPGDCVPYRNVKREGCQRIVHASFHNSNGVCVYISNVAL